MPNLAVPSALPTDLPLFAGVPREKVPHVLKCLNAMLSTYRKGCLLYTSWGRHRASKRGPARPACRAPP